MIKIVLLGVWVCAVTLVSTWAGANLLSGPVEADVKHEEGIGGLEVVKPRQISVPIITDGAIQGYVMVKLSFTVRKDDMSKLSLSPDVFIVDETFKTIYGGEPIDFKRIAKPDLEKLGKSIKDNVNKRFGTPFVEDVLFEEVNYIAMEKVRGGTKVR
jgi:flagellar basal body-associated protein FliL